jgi:hypothetical protein
MRNDYKDLTAILDRAGIGHIETDGEIPSTDIDLVTVRLEGRRGIYFVFTSANDPEVAWKLTEYGVTEP